MDDQECVTTVDVADGQQLMIDLAPLDEVDYKKLCPMSEKAALMALQTLAVVCLLAVVFAPSTGGVATPGGQDDPAGETPRSGSPNSPEPTVEIPPRPEDLQLDGVKPCSLFTQAQLNQLKITDPPTSKTSSGYFEAPGCDLEIATLETFRSYEALTVTQEGIGPWLSGKRNVEAKLSEVAGYPAATYWLRGGQRRGSQLHP